MNELFQKSSQKPQKQSLNNGKVWKKTILTSYLLPITGLTYRVCTRVYLSLRDTPPVAYKPDYTDLARCVLTLGSNLGWFEPISGSYTEDFWWNAHAEAGFQLLAFELLTLNFVQVSLFWTD